jgi:hypothetical protein
MISEQRGGARAFVRSLNILLKFARLYEFGHARTAAQFETAWKELRGALDDSGGGGVLLGASGTQIDYIGNRENSFFTDSHTTAIRAICARLSQRKRQAFLPRRTIENRSGGRYQHQGQRNPLRC